MEYNKEEKIDGYTYYKDDELAAVCEYRGREESYLIHRFKLQSIPACKILCRAFFYLGPGGG